MVTQKLAQTIDGKVFTIGGRVLSRQNNDYRHLFGTVKDFVSGEESSNEPKKTYIVCDFKAPEAIGRRENLEDRFSNLHGCKLKAEDIALDCVVMSAEMLEPIPEHMPLWEHMNESPYVLTYQDEGENGIAFGSLGVSYDIGILLRAMLDSIGTYDLRLEKIEEADDLLCFSYEGKGKYRFVEFEISRAKFYPRAERLG